jgi:hypothetical protein
MLSCGSRLVEASRASRLESRLVDAASTSCNAQGAAASTSCNSPSAASTSRVVDEEAGEGELQLVEAAAGVAVAPP